MTAGEMQPSLMTSRRRGQQLMLFQPLDNRLGSDFISQRGVVRITGKRKIRPLHVVRVAITDELRRQQVEGYARVARGFA